MKSLPYGLQHIDEEDISSVVEVLRGKWLTTGPMIERFEESLAEKTGSKYAISCSSGTAALYLAAMTLDLRQGDCVIVPSITFLATASAPYLAGASIVFADVDPKTGLLTPEAFEDALRRAEPARVRAVLPVHLNGLPIDLTPIREIADSKGIKCIEDACHALGGFYGDSKNLVGSCPHSDMTVFSFHPVKTIAMGEGGAVTTSDQKLAERLRCLRNNGIIRNREDFIFKEQAIDSSGRQNLWYYELSQPSLNFRSSDINCALGFSQLKKLQDFVKKRSELKSLYDYEISKLSDNVISVGDKQKSKAAWHLCAVLVDFEKLNICRNSVMKKLSKLNIFTQVHYLPVHRQPFFAKKFQTPYLPGAETYYSQALSLPLFFDMNDADVKTVVRELSKALGL